jgi:hypothetical protein
MINQPNPASAMTRHAIVGSLINPATGRFEITVGSWLEADEDEKPKTTKTLVVQYSAWLPEYFEQKNQVVNEHPDWTGLGPYRPSEHAVFLMESRQWIDPRTLPDLKDAKWLAIKSARSQAEYAGFTWDGSTFDSDPVSQQRLVAAVTQAQMDASFSIGWTLKDNSVRQLDAVQMQAVGAALGAHVATQFAHGQGLRARIEAATTAAEVAGMVW